MAPRIAGEHDIALHPPAALAVACGLKLLWRLDYVSAAGNEGGTGGLVSNARILDYEPLAIAKRTCTPLCSNLGLGTNMLAPLAIPVCDASMRGAAPPLRLEESSGCTSAPAAPGLPLEGMLWQLKTVEMPTHTMNVFKSAAAMKLARHDLHPGLLASAEISAPARPVVQYQKFCRRNTQCGCAGDQGP